jgi:hypothetical protein
MDMAENLARIRLIDRGYRSKTFFLVFTPNFHPLLAFSASRSDFVSRSIIIKEDLMLL